MTSRIPQRYQWLS